MFIIEITNSDIGLDSGLRLRYSLGFRFLNPQYFLSAILVSILPQFHWCINSLQWCVEGKGELCSLQVSTNSSNPGYPQPKNINYMQNRDVETLRSEKRNQL